MFNMLLQMNSHPEVGPASMRLQTELKRRFKRYTDPSDEKFEYMFLLGTSLDPRYRLILNPIQLSAAKAQLYKEVCTNY